MSAITSPMQAVCVSPVGNRLVITVSRDKADRLQTYLRGHGISSTVCLDPAAGSAHLEPWTTWDPQKLQALVGEWEGCRLAAARRDTSPAPTAA